MQAAIPFPQISPEIFSITIGGFEFALRWYALAYILALVIGWRVAVAAVKRSALWPEDRAPMKPAEVEALMTWVVLGVILGGRLGFVLFYQPGYYLQNPAEIPMLWRGGMSFHGGLLGVVVGGWLFARMNGLPALSVGDAMALATPPGLLLGRLANFINAELWGRPTDMPWGVIFPGPMAQDCPGPTGIVGTIPTYCARHPSQLYEALLEGVVLGAILLWLAFARGWLRRPGAIAGAFFLGYGLARMFVELFRQADPQFITPENPLGHVISLTPTLGLSMGQLLSLPMVLLGAGLIAFARARARTER